jgi:hypothetical protein
MSRTRATGTEVHHEDGKAGKREIYRIQHACFFFVLGSLFFGSGRFVGQERLKSLFKSYFWHVCG